jgi:hypothetical protein
MVALMWGLWSQVLSRLGTERDERGDVPGWVLITVMTAGLVAATVDRPLEAGAERTRAQIAHALAARFARRVTASETVVDGTPVVRVDVVAEVPPLGLWGPAVRLAVSGHAIEETLP